MCNSLRSTLPEVAAFSYLAKRCTTSSTALEVSACERVMCSWAIRSVDPAVCAAVANAYSATFRVACAVAATWLTSEAAVDATRAANNACRYAIVNPTGDTDRSRRMPALVSIGDCARRIL